MEFIHIAGTNGKGSTAHYLAEILGIRHSCGLFTSPHIFSPTERFVINGQPISQSEYDSRMKDAGKLPDEHWFGVWVRVAMDLFYENNMDYAIFETGLGGRRDPTNVIDATMQIITPVSFDHMQDLGDTLEKIAQEKCGIIKRDSVVISHPQQPEVMDVIRKTCNRMNAFLIVLDPAKIRVKKTGTDGQVFDFSFEDMRLSGVRLRSPAPIQVQNACVAAIAAKELGISQDDILEGLQKTNIVARAQIVGDLVFDAAHNPAALHELGDTIKTHFKNRNVTVLTAVMEDKDIHTMAGEIEQFADQVICSCAAKKRGSPGKELAKYFKNAKSMEDPAYAFEYAKQLATQKKGILVVCGSFYLMPFVLDVSGEAQQNILV